MNALRVGLALLVFLLPLHAAGDEKPSTGEKKPSPPTSGVTSTETSQRKVVEIVLPGRLLSTSLPNFPLVLLVSIRSPDGGRTRSVLEFDPTGEGRLEVLATGLSKHIETIHTLPRDGGQREILLGEPGAIHRLNTHNKTLEPLLTARHLDLGTSKRLSSGIDLLVPRVGLLESWKRKDTGTLERHHSFDLPVQVERQRGGLRLFTPPLNRLRGDTASRVILGPVPQGTQRLHSVTLDFASPTGHEPESKSQDSWALLPAPETVEDRWYVSMDDQPVLVVTTTNAEKLGIFEKKKLRVFPLRDDRTRSGRPPSLAIETTTRRWFSPSIEVLDWDDDGKDDLAVMAPDGLGAKKLVLSVYSGKGNGTFHSRPRKSVLTAPQAKWRYGTDLNGDLRPDLVAADENGLRIFAGVTTDQKKGVVEKTPQVTWAFKQLAASPGVRRVLAEHEKEDGDLQLRRLRVVDLDGDGQGEVLAQARLAGRTVLWWVTLHGSGT